MCGCVSGQREDARGRARLPLHRPVYLLVLLMLVLTASPNPTHAPQDYRRVEHTLGEGGLAAAKGEASSEEEEDVVTSSSEEEEEEEAPKKRGKKKGGAAEEEAAHKVASPVKVGCGTVGLLGICCAAWLFRPVSECPTMLIAPCLSTSCLLLIWGML